VKGDDQTDFSDQEFLRALHEEKVTAQNERASYVTRKLAFVTLLFGISSLDLGLEMEQVYWLLYLIPMVAICYDSHITSADARVKRIGAFLGRHPGSMAGEVERQWESFSSVYRSPFAPFADLSLSLIVTLAAAVYLNSEQRPGEREMASLFFATWLTLSLAVIVCLWARHRKLLWRIDRYGLDLERPADLIERRDRA